MLPLRSQRRSLEARSRLSPCGTSSHSGSAFPVGCLHGEGGLVTFHSVFYLCPSCQSSFGVHQEGKAVPYTVLHLLQHRRAPERFAEQGAQSGVQGECSDALGGIQFTKVLCLSLLWIIK
ncbi:unnamed protein product [Gulo gulo]|uniref:Uncharacterized protein n=1 Tax=Gulo gulo TaxID=48420 RepID=A0A9X9Q2B0_GULGU|nr:unnamed protein product [Gulo gulo]